MSGLGAVWGGIASALGSSGSSGSSSSSSGSSTSSSSGGGGSSIWGGIFNGILSGLSSSSSSKDASKDQAAAIDQTGRQQRLTYMFQKQLDTFYEDYRIKNKYDAAKQTYGKNFSSLDKFAPSYSTTYKGPRDPVGPSDPRF